MRKLVAVSGGFDPFHIGHLRLIKETHKLGDVVVILNTDDFLIRKKGYVFIPLLERKEILEGIRWVKRVVISVDKDDSVCKTLELVKPDIFANGGDRKGETDIRETDVCHRLKIKMVFGVGGDKIQSSSRLVQKVKEDYADTVNRERSLVSDWVWYPTSTISSSIKGIRARCGHLRLLRHGWEHAYMEWHTRVPKSA